MGKKIIVFGAGNFGLQALSYYGVSEVAYFADNSKEKIGRTINNIEIIDFEKLKSIYQNFRIIVATNSYETISNQLRENNINDFEIYLPRYEKVMSKLPNDFNGKNIILLGVDEFTKVVLKQLENRLCKNIIITDRDDLNTNQKMYKYKIENFEEVSKENAIVIISSSKKNAALYVYARRIVGEELTIINPFEQTKYYDTPEIIYSYYGDNGGNQTEEEWNSSMVNSYEKSAINEYVDELGQKIPLFEHIEIETINRCNGVCEFCPVSAGNDIRPKKIMEAELFYKIIDQLAELDYSGRLATFSNNEPFLDDRIIDFNRYARNKLPKARMHLFTNGTLLTLDKFKEITPLLDELIIDNYNQELLLNTNSKIIKEYCEEHTELKDKVTIVMRKPKEILTSRGGDAPNRMDIKSYPDIKCALPYKQMIIRPDGKVSLCCNDPYGRCTLGDTNKESLVDIWYGEKFTSVRNAIKKGRGNFEHCKNCDTFIVF